MGLAPDPFSATLTREGDACSVLVRFAHVPERLLLYSLLPEQAPFRVTTAEGRELIPVAMTQPEPDSLALLLPEDPGPNCLLHGANVRNPYPVQPTEVSTRLPVLSFCDLPIEKA